MKNIIYYFTGTGNSLWTARILAKEIGGAELVSMLEPNKKRSIAKVKSIGLVFPVHMWGIPNLVLKFIDKMPKSSDIYYYAAAVNAGQVSRTLVQLGNIFKKQRLILSSGIDIVMPSNYIPWGGPGPLENQKKCFDDTHQRIKQRSVKIKNLKTDKIDKGPLWQRIIFTALYKITFNMIRKMDKDFWTDDKCNFCGICVKICPAKNILLREGKPGWMNNCEQCLSCIQWCPTKSIQYGKKTPGYERYHHPEVKIADILTSVGKKKSR
jgi:ferredoxin